MSVHWVSNTHVIPVGGEDSITGQHYEISVDPNGLLATRGYIWDTNSLSWIADTGGGGGGGGSVTVTNFPVLDSYYLSDYDAIGPIYVGNLDPNGKWYIEKIDTTTGAALYAAGNSGYNWAGRAGLTYQAFNVVF